MKGDLSGSRWLFSGNDAADSLANGAADTVFMGSYPFCAVSGCVANKFI